MSDNQTITQTHSNASQEKSKKEPKISGYCDKCSTNYKTDHTDAKCRKYCLIKEKANLEKQKLQKNQESKGIEYLQEIEKLKNLIENKTQEFEQFKKDEAQKIKEIEEKADQQIKDIEKQNKISGLFQKEGILNSNQYISQKNPSILIFNDNTWIYLDKYSRKDQIKVVRTQFQKCTYHPGFNTLLTFCKLYIPEKNLSWDNNGYQTIKDPFHIFSDCLDMTLIQYVLITNIPRFDISKQKFHLDQFIQVIKAVIIVRINEFDWYKNDGFGGIQIKQQNTNDNHIKTIKATLNVFIAMEEQIKVAIKFNAITKNDKLSTLLGEIQAEIDSIKLSITKGRTDIFNQ